MNSIVRAPLKCFLWSGIIWFFLGLGFVLWISIPDLRWVAGGWFSLFWVLVMVDFATIAGLVGSMLLWQDSSDRARLGVRVAVLGVLKVLWLVLFGAILFLKHGIPNPSLLVGLGTLIIVPLFGGLAWSFQARPEGTN